jgi:Ca2+-binding RTX toxin-like protein
MISSEIDSVFSTVDWTLGSNLEKLTLQGSNAVDALGNELNNTLTGNAAANLLDGLLGNDILKGGLGADIFRLSTSPDVQINMDTIADFNVADDTIELDSHIFTALALGVLPASQFIKGAGISFAADTNDNLIYNNTTGQLYYDADGSNAEIAPVQIALIGISSHAALTNADFFVI